MGGLVLFLLGWLIYGVILAGSMEGAPCMRSHEEVEHYLHWIGIGNLFTGLAIAYVFSKIPALSTFGGGAMVGGITGILFSIGWDCLMYGTTTMMAEPSGIALDVVISGVMWAIAGGVIAWWLGRGPKMA
jgi:hypothetical protein